MKASIFLEHLAIALFAMGLVAYILIQAKLWASNYSLWFLRLGDFQSFILLSIGVYLFAKILEKFLRWEINVLFPHRRRHK